MSSEDSLALWREYRRTNDRALRDRLVLTFAPLVKYIVYKKLREMPARCEAEDFIACGLEALIHSIERYDPEKGATLEQYAWTRIHGAVLDELRRQDWAPRSVRRWERDIEKVVEQFNVLHNRRPTTEEVADALGVEVGELRRRSWPTTRRPSSASTRSPATTSARTPCTPPPPARRRTASAPPSPACRAASARWRSCCT
jgi:RNA polymerase sigma factor for flagellar operon FliA